MNEVSGWILNEMPNDAFGMNKALLATTLSYSARCNGELGQIAQAREDAARSMAVARETNNQFAWVFAYIAEAWVNFRAGDSERALPFLEKAYDICLNDEVPLMAPVAGSFLSLVLLHAARDPGILNQLDGRRALALAECAVDQGIEFQFHAFQPMRLAILSRALSANGRQEEALKSALMALEGARTQLEPTSELEALLSLSQASCRLGANWQEPLQNAFCIAKALHMAPALLHCEAFELACKNFTFPQRN
jgi:tetratricopeptide (TPR) repeat protein